VDEERMARLLVGICFVIFSVFLTLLTSYINIFLQHLCSDDASRYHSIIIIGPIANLKGHYFQPSLSVTLCVCL